MSLEIKMYLQRCYPEIHDVLQFTSTIPRIEKRQGFLLPEAVVRVIIGQMLSGKAADTIYSRVRTAANDKNLSGSWMLDHQTLRNCGLSGAKANAILEVNQRIGGDGQALNHWFSLSPEELVNEIKSFRGMGAWSAGILALFYVGHEDIFPVGDGSLQRAMRLIADNFTSGSGDLIDISLAAPYRSYLALYLWQILDTGMLNVKSSTVVDDVSPAKKNDLK